jgi:hypothetical protein
MSDAADGPFVQEWNSRETDDKIAAIVNTMTEAKRLGLGNIFVETSDLRREGKEASSI